MLFTIFEGKFEKNIENRVKKIENWFLDWDFVYIWSKHLQLFFIK